MGNDPLHRFSSLTVAQVAVAIAVLATTLEKAYRLFQFRKRAISLPLTPIENAIDGIIAVQGLARPASGGTQQTLENEAAVYHQLSVVEIGKQSNQLIYQSLHLVPFQLDDNTGLLFINPKPDEIQVTETKTLWDGSDGPFSKRIGKPLPHSTYEIRESYIRSGSTLFAIGKFQGVNPSKVNPLAPGVRGELLPLPSADFLVTDQERTNCLKSSSNKKTLWAITAAILFLSFALFSFWSALTTYCRWHPNGAWFGLCP